MLRFAKDVRRASPSLPVRHEITAGLRCSVSSSSSVLIQARFDKSEARFFWL